MAGLEIRSSKPPNMTRGGWAFQAWFILFMSALLVTPITVNAQSPPAEKECIAYAFTESESHLFLIGKETMLFGSNLTVVHNCAYASIELNGSIMAGSNDSFTIPIEPGLYNITIGLDDNRTLEFDNVRFFPERLNWEFEWLEIQESRPTFIELAKADVQLNWAVSFSIVIVWVLSTYVYWSLINSYTQRTFVEEVAK